MLQVAQEVKIEMLSCWFEQFLLQPWVDMLHHFSDTSSLAVFEDAALFQDRGLGHSTLLYCFHKTRRLFVVFTIWASNLQLGPATTLKTEDLHRSRVDDRDDRLLPPRDFEEITEVVRNDLKIVPGTWKSGGCRWQVARHWKRIFRKSSFLSDLAGLW